MRPCGELKLVTGVQLGGLFATDRSCSYGVRQLWVAGWPLFWAIAGALLANLVPICNGPWCREALKVRRALDKTFRHSWALRGETISALRRSQAKARRLFNQKKRQSWAEYVSKLSAETPIKHVWDRVRKISGKNICPPKQYLNGKNGTTITNPKDIANEHAAVFTDNSSSAHYSATFQAIKEQEEKVKIDFISDNTQVYNKPFRLRDLRRSIMKAKPRAPGPDGIHNNLLKHLPEDTLEILKEILNKIWISADFPHQWRAATVIPIPKPNKDHTDPLSYRPIALTSCLCKVLERMINTCLIWYLEKYRILDRSQCGFRKHRSTTDHLVSLERYVRDAFAQRQQAVGLFFDLEKAYETTWQYGIIRDLHGIGLRGRLPVFVSEYLRDRRIWVRIGTTLSDEFYPEEGVPTGGVLAVTCFGLKINELPSCIAKDIFKALFVDDLAIGFRGRSLDTIERHLQQAVNAIQEWATRNGFRFAAHKCKVIHFTAPRSRAQRPPIVRIGNTLLPVEESTKFLGLRISHLRSTSVCWRHSVRRLSTSSEWSLTWNGEGTETHSWCCTVPLFYPSLTMVALCMARHQTPTYDNWTAFITLDWDWHWELSAPAQCPACTQRPTKLLWRNVG